MRFIALSLGINSGPDGRRRFSSKERLDDIVAQARWAEDAGLDGFGVGEHHTHDTEVSSPPVLLAAIAARTTTLRLFTGVTVLSLLDPVRVYEDYATLDNLSDGRVEIIIGKGNTEAQSQVFGHTNESQWERNAEKYELLRRLIDEPTVTWSGRYRPDLVDFSARPRFLQDPPRIWHGSATSTLSTELAARHGDPLFSANVTGHREQYLELVADYRRRWAAYGRDPAGALVGAGSAAVHVGETSQQARAEFEPIFAARLERASTFKQAVPFATLEEAIAGGSYFVGSAAEVTEQLLDFVQVLDHQVQHIGEIELTDPVRRSGIERFVDHVIPEVRRHVPDRLWSAENSDLGPVGSTSSGTFPVPELISEGTS